jgi:hypothetical protein
MFGWQLKFGVGIFWENSSFITGGEDIWVAILARGGADLWVAV